MSARKPKPLQAFIFYRGASLIDGAPIVGIAIPKSANSKTGNMVQTYILRGDMMPLVAIKSGADVSICGACPHRGDGTGKGRTCYVNVGQGPTAVARRLLAGSGYEDRSHDHGRGLLAGRKVRLGTYGDPSAIPAAVWEDLLEGAAGWTGYTHQWQAGGACEGNALQLAHLVMASADTESDVTAANAAGFRTFRVMLPGEKRQQGEALCPSDPSRARKLPCHECMACHGTQGKARGNIAINMHGGFGVMANAKTLAARLIA
jgi:hypothetical protein